MTISADVGAAGGGGEVVDQASLVLAYRKIINIAKAIEEVMHCYPLFVSPSNNIICISLWH